jgi:hypothetical protein
VFSIAKGPDRLWSPFDLLFIEHRGCFTASKGTCVCNSPPIIIQWRGQPYVELKKVGSVLSTEGSRARHLGLYVIQIICTKCALEWWLSFVWKVILICFRVSFSSVCISYFAHLKQRWLETLTTPLGHMALRSADNMVSLQTCRKTLTSSYPMGFHQLPCLIVQTNDISK